MRSVEADDISLFAAENEVLGRQQELLRAVAPCHIGGCKLSSVQKPRLYIANFFNYGKHVKNDVAQQFIKLGYEVVTVGEPLTYANSFIAVDLNKLSFSNCEQPNDNNYKQLAYRDIILWDVCRGTARYRAPKEVFDMDRCMPSILPALYVEARALIDCFELLFESFNEDDVLLTWSGLQHDSYIARLIAQKLKIKIFTTEFSFVPGRIYFEPCGVIGNQHSFRHLWTNGAYHPLNQKQHQQIRAWVSRNYKGKSNQRSPAESQHYIESIISKEKPNVIILGQCHVDTVMCYDNPEFESAFDAYSRVIQVLLSKNCNVIFKCHPGDKDFIKQLYQDEFSKLAGVTVISDNNDCNVYSLMDHCEVGVTINSQAGLEMLVKGKNVLILGTSFYAGCGFGNHLDSKLNLTSAVEQLLDNPTLGQDAIVACETFLYRYIHSYLFPRKSSAQHFHKAVLAAYPKPKINSAAKKEQTSGDLRILFIHPSSRDSGSGFYMNDISSALNSLGVPCMVLCEGSCPMADSPVMWRSLTFDGPYLSRFIKDSVAEFSPTVIVQVGVRSKVMRAGLELCLSHKSLFVVQAEDDEDDIFFQRYPKPKQELLKLLDAPEISPQNLKEFLSLLDADHFLKTIKNPYHDRMVEPVLRALCYHRADLYTAIWYPMADRLMRKFAKPAFLLPPIVDTTNYRIPQKKNEIQVRIRQAYGISKDSLLIFISGNIYLYSDEFKRFCEALLILADSAEQHLTLALTGRNLMGSSDSLSSLEQAGIQVLVMDIPKDKEYEEMIITSDIIAAPGIPSRFNKYRLASRLVKAMLLEKAIFTFECGFGEYLKDGFHAVLTKTDDPIEWATKLKTLSSLKFREDLGVNARAYASKHFCRVETAKKIREILSRFTY